MKKIVVLFSESASSLRYLFEKDKNYGKDYEIVCAIANKKNTEGENFCKENHIPFVESNTKDFCCEHDFYGKIRDIPIWIRKDYFKNMLNLIKQYNPDIILLSGFMLEITEPLLSYCPIIQIENAEDLTTLSEDNNYTEVGLFFTKKSLLIK